MSRGSMIGLALLAVTCARGAVTIVEETVDGQPAVVMENAFIKLVVHPGRGGECTDFVYKPTGKRLVLPRVGKIFGNRVWNYLDQELYMQWQQAAWEPQVQRAPGEVALTLRAPGEINFTRATVIEKRLSLRDGEALVRVKTTFSVGQELMQSFPIGLWFANLVGVVGEPTRYYLPLDNGILKLDPSTITGESWLYNPSRGWAGAVGESGTGLSFEMDYQRLMCFYLWSGRQTSLEWAFRTADVPHGGSLSTDQVLVPFAGLPALNGSGGGVVAAVEAPDRCTAAEAAQGVKAKALLTTGVPVDGQLTVTLKPLPEGQPVAVHQGQVALKPGEVTSVELTVRPPGPGTFLLTGSLSRGGQEVMDFVKPLVAGDSTVPVRLTPKVERTGRATERFEDRVALSGGGGPRDIELSMAVESPHVKWARPYRQGKLKTLVLTSCLTGREAVELAQRLDSEILWVTTGGESELASFSWVFGLGKKFTYDQVRMNENIKEKLTGPVDAILVGGQMGSIFSAEVLDLFARKVAEGTGLVYVAPNRGPDKLYDLLPVKKESQPRNRDGRWQVVKQHAITTGVPLEVLPATDYARHEATGEVLAQINGQPLLAVSEGPGKGRVVAMTWCAGWQGSGNWSSGITPWVENKDCQFDYWEYYFSLLAKSLVWAAHKESPVALSAIEADAAGPQVTLTLANSGPALAGTADVKLCDATGFVEHRATEKVALAAGTSSLKLPLGKAIPGGLHLADVILRDGEGRVVGWGSAALRAPETVRVTELSLDKRAYNPGETIKATVKLAAPTATPVAVRVTLTDRLGRLVEEAEQQATAQAETAVEVALPVGQPLATGAAVRAVVSAGGQPVAVAERPVITFTPEFAERRWGDWESCVWGTPGGAYQREYLLPVYADLYRDYGVDTVLAAGQWLYDREFEWPVREGFKIMPMSVSFGAINVGHRVPQGKLTFSEQATKYQSTHDKQYLVRPVCLSSEADLAPLAERLRGVAEFAGWLQPVGYNLGDEMSTTHYTQPFDYDFHPDALKAFRDWLRGEYRDLPALNAEWETRFATWEEVMPLTAQEVNGRRNFAPWADHRAFMDASFAKFFEWVRDRLREKDPGAGVGMSGSQAAEAYGGYDWFQMARTLDFIQNYTHQNTPVMQRSFAPNLPRAPWYGYTTVNPQMRWTMWWRLFGGNYGGSYWSTSFMFRPDLLPSPMTADAAPVVKELRGGVATLLKHCRRVSDIGVHYSQASIRGAFISQGAALFRDNRMGWIQAFEDLGYQCEFAAQPEIEAGALRERGYKVFVLPYSVALSAAEVAELRRFVENGGLLLADAKIGLMDEHCRTLDKALLDDLFGVTRQRPEPLGASREGEVKLSSDTGACKLAGLTFDLSVAEPALGLAGGEALGQHGEVPVAVVKRTGKGAAVLLNFYLDTFQQRRAMGIEGPLAALVRNLLLLADVKPPVGATLEAGPAQHLFTVRYTAGEGLYVGAAMDPGERAADWSTKLTVKLPKSGMVYDVRSARKLGRTDQVTTPLLAGDAALYAVLPYGVAGLKVTPAGQAKPGGALGYAVEVAGRGGRPGLHVVNLEVKDAAGRSRPEYAARLVTQDGQAKASCPLALNDPPGRWTIRATDLVSGVTGEAVATVGR